MGALRLNQVGFVDATAFTATNDIELKGIRLVGTGLVPKASAWLSNGFQSWSQSGVLQIGRKTTEAELPIGTGLSLN